MIKVAGGYILNSSMTRDSERRTVDGFSFSCGTNCDHAEKFARSPTAVFHQQHNTPPAMLDSRLGTSAPPRKLPRDLPGSSRREGI